MTPAVLFAGPEPSKIMSPFIAIMIVGLIGLFLMVVPGLAGHGHAGAALRGAGHGNPLSHGGHAPALHTAHAASTPHGAAPHSAPSPASATQSHDGQAVMLAETRAAAPAGSLFRLAPSPRAIFSVLAIYGASGFALVDSLRAPLIVACIAAVIPAIAVERLLLTPLWNYLFQFQGEPSKPLEELVLCEAVAVTPFRNGRGIVSVDRDGRLIQLSAGLVDHEASLPVAVGDKLRIEDVDRTHERVTVSMLSE